MRRSRVQRSSLPQKPILEVFDYHPEIADGEEIIVAIQLIHKTIATLSLNANETLALHALLLKCPSLSALSRNNTALVG